MTKPILFDLVLDKCKRDSAHEAPWPIIGRLKDVPAPFIVDVQTVMRAWNLPEHLDLTVLGLLPYESTWVEWSLEDLPQAADTTMGQPRPERIGYLLTRRGGEVALRFNAPEIVTVDCFAQVRRKATFTRYSLIFDGKRDCPVYAHLMAPGERERYAEMPPQESETFRKFAFAAQKLPEWSSKVGGIITTMSMGGTIDLGPYTPAVQILLGVLAMMAHCQYSRRTVEPLGFWRNKKNRPQAHTVHSIVSIETSERTVHKRLESHPTGIHHREHDVRGHWRTLRRGRPDEYRVAVRPHRRGDPTIGQVVHDAYETVEHERITPMPQGR